MKERVFLSLSLFVLSACAFREFCDFSVHLSYRYVGHDTARGSLLKNHLTGIEQYIYAAEGRLVAIERLNGSAAAANHFNHVLSLPPGTYTLMTWGNRSDDNTAVDGAEHLTNARLINRAPSNEPAGYLGNGDRLYYGRQTFSVEAGQVTHLKVDISEQHASLIVHFIGFDFSPSRAEQSKLYMQLTGVPFVCDFSRGQAGGDTTAVHRTEVRINLDGEAGGRFDTFRFRSDSHPMLSLHDRSGRQLMRPIDLHKWFAEQSFSLDAMTTQQFEIEVEQSRDIDGQITVSSVIDGWEPGW